MAEQPLSKRMHRFVCFHLGDKHAFAPFTGQDYSAWNTFLYALELYGRGDYNGQRSALNIMRQCLSAAQRKLDVLAIFKKSIPGVLDWGFEAKLWSQVGPTPGDMPAHVRDNREGDLRVQVGVVWPCADGERICSHIHSKPSKKHAGWFECKDPLCKATWRPDSSAEVTAP